MITTVTFYASEKLQKKLISEGKNSEKKQSIELDIQDQELIDLASVKNGIAVIEIPEYRYHYDNEKNQKYVYYHFDNILTENDIIIYFQNEKILNNNDKKIEAEKKQEREKREKLEKIENEKRKKEREEIEKIENEKRAEIKKNIDLFVDQYGSELAKMRKKLKYEYEDLVRQEFIDLYFSGYEEKFGLIRLESDEMYSYIKQINHPRLELMKLEKEISELKFVNQISLEIWNESNYGDIEKIEVIEIGFVAFEKKVIRSYKVN